jgi:hypothetical protein
VTMDLNLELYDKLKRQFPELEEGVVKEALVLYGNNFDGARKALQVRVFLCVECVGCQLV